MARRPTGEIIEHQGADGLTYRSVRFRAYGQRRRLSLGPISRVDPEKALRGVLADVEGGVWREAEPQPSEPEGVPTFHEFAEQWWIEREREWRDTTRGRYRECVELHLLPFFGATPLDRIVIADVDRYKAAKLREGKLVAATINKTLVLLSSIFEAAEERDLIARNPARWRRRRVRAPKPRRSYLDTSEQIVALLEAAGQLDTEARRDRQHIHRRAALSVLTFAGLRLGELLSLRWRDVDLATGRLRVGDSKTEAGRRDVSIRPVLRDELFALKVTAGDVAPGSLVLRARSSSSEPMDCSQSARRTRSRTA